MQTSFPLEPPQPNQEFYGLEALLLVKTYTRDSFRSAGNGDPVFDPSRPEQNWWDNTYDGKSGPVSFDAIQYTADGAAAIVQITQDAKAMSTPNFKGLPHYPAWAPPPTAAVQPRAAGARATPVDPNDLSTPEQAQELFVELGGTRVVDTGASSVTLPGIGEIVFPISYPAGDSRRAFAIVLTDGKIANVGQALGEKYGAGVGHPGHWIMDPTRTSGLHWQVDPVPDGSLSTAAAVPPPCRALKANEQLHTTTVGTFFRSTQIRRTDLAGPEPGAASDLDAVMLTDLQLKITAIYNLLIPR
jgi:hypothetical protein